MRNIIVWNYYESVNSRRIAISLGVSPLSTEQVLSFPNDKPTVWRRNIMTEKLIKRYKMDSGNRCSRDGQQTRTYIRSDWIARPAIIV